jgi:hypothetical protein
MTRSSTWHQQQAQLERAWLNAWARTQREAPEFYGRKTPRADVVPARSRLTHA